MRAGHLFWERGREYLSFLELVSIYFVMEKGSRDDNRKVGNFFWLISSVILDSLLFSCLMNLEVLVSRIVDYFLLLI